MSTERERIAEQLWDAREEARYQTQLKRQSDCELVRPRPWPPTSLWEQEEVRRDAAEIEKMLRDCAERAWRRAFRASTAHDMDEPMPTLPADFPLLSEEK
jgi:hypothetical protein